MLWFEPRMAPKGPRAGDLMLLRDGRAFGGWGMIVGMWVTGDMPLTQASSSLLFWFPSKCSTDHGPRADKN